MSAGDVPAVAVGAWMSVFISHTSDTVGYPPGRSFVRAALDTVLKAGAVPVDMAYFAAREGKPAEYCEQRVQACGVYVGLVGFRYGSPVPGRNDSVSYTDLEFRTATDAGIPRLVFLLDDDAPIPPRLVDLDRTAVEAFRDRLRNAGVIVKTVDTADALEAALLHALHEVVAGTMKSAALAQAGHLLGPVDPRAASATVVGDLGERDEPANEEWSARLAVLSNEWPARSVPNPVALYGYQSQKLQGDAAIKAQKNLIVIHGMGGVGKTFLAAILAREHHERFKKIVWFSLRNPPGLKQLVISLISELAPERPTDEDRPVEALLDQLFDVLERQRYLVVLDNLEAVFELGRPAGTYRIGYTDYKLLFRRFGAASTSSTAVVTTRELSGDLLEPVLDQRCEAIRLDGLDQTAAFDFMKSIGLTGRARMLRELSGLLFGNPQAIRLAKGLVENDFGGSVDGYLSGQGHAVGSVYDLIRDHWERTSPTERDILYWLTVTRRPVVLDDLALTLAGIDYRAVASACGSLNRRCLVEYVGLSNGKVAIDLQNLLVEFLTDELAIEVAAEISSAVPRLVRSFPLIQASAPEYIRLAQCRLIVDPILALMQDSIGPEPDIDASLRATIEQQRHAAGAGYTIGNMLNLLIRMQADLTGIDLRNSEIREVDFSSVQLIDVNLASAKLDECRFLGDFDNVLSVAFSPDLRRSATGSMSGDMRVWDTSSWSVTGRSRQHTDWVWAVSFNRDGTLLASGSADQTVRIWEMPSGACRVTLQGHRERVFSLAWSPLLDMVVSGGEDGTVRLWDGISGEQKLVWEVSRGRIWSLVFSSDGTTVVAGSEDGSLIALRIDQAEFLWARQAHQGRVRAIAADGDLVASGGEDGKVHIWDMDSEHILAHRTTLRHGSEQVRSIAISSSKSLLVSAGDDRTISVWSIRSGQLKGRLTGHRNAVMAVALSRDGSSLLSGSDDQTARVWDMRNRRCAKILSGYTNPMWSVVTIGDSLVASLSEDGLIRFWNLDSGDCYRRLTGHRARIWSVAAAPEAGILASSSEDQTIKIWDLREGKIREISNYTTTARSISLSQDGHLISSGSGRAVRVWDVASAQEIVALDGHSDWVRSVAFFPGSDFLASGGEDGRVIVWDLSTGAAVESWPGHEAGVWAVAVSPDGLVASASRDRTIRLWRIGVGRVATLVGHRGWVRSVAFSHDGIRLASSSEDLTVGLWNTTADGRPIRLMRGHSARIISVSFSGDDGRVVSASQDQTVRVWSTDPPQEERVLRPDRPYERMMISGIRGISREGRDALVALGAID